MKGGFITFTKYFKYFGSYISYSLLDNYDIYARIASGNASMVSLHKFWTDASVNNCSKYLIFLSIPITLILWGCEIWALRTFLLLKLEVFLHIRILHILGFSMTEVKVQCNTN